MESKESRSLSLLASERDTVARDSKEFCMAEIESLIETFAATTVTDIKNGFKILPKQVVVDDENRLLPYSELEQKFTGVIQKSINDPKLSRTKFLILLNFGLSQNIPSSVGSINLDYERSEINVSAQDLENNDLGLLCFQKDETEKINYYYLAPKKFVNKEWVDKVFLAALPKNSPQSLIAGTVLPTPKVKLHADAELCYQVEQFFVTGAFNKGHSEIHEQLAKKYLKKLEDTFYSKRSFSSTLKSSSMYFTGVLIGYMIFMGSRYVETLLIMKHDETLLESTTIPVTVMRVVDLLAVRPLESLKVMGATAYGAKQYEELGSLLRTGWVASLVLSSLIIPVLCTSEYWLKHIFSEADSIKEAANFLKIYSLAIPVLTATVADNNIFFAANQPGIVGLIELVSIVAGIGLTYGFVYGKLGLPAQGLAGFAISLVIQKWINFFSAKAFLYATRHSRKYTVLSMPSCSDIWQKLKLVFRKGLPLTLQIGVEQLYLFVVTVYAGLYAHSHNTKALEQANIINENFILFSVVGGMVCHTTMMQRVGEVRGRDLILREKHADLGLVQQNLQNVPQIIYANAVIGFVYTAFVASLFCFACPNLVSSYLDPDTFTPSDIEAINRGICPLFKIMAACTLTEMVGNLLGGAINGLGDVDSPMIRSFLVTGVLGAGLGYFFCFNKDWGLTGVYSASVIAYGVGILALGATLCSLYNKLKSADASENNKTSWCCSIFGKNSQKKGALLDDKATDIEDLEKLPISKDGRRSVSFSISELGD